MTTQQDHRSETLVHDNSSDDMEQQKKSWKQNTWIKYLIGDPYVSDDPQKLSMRHKQIIIFIVALSGISGPLASMIVSIVSSNVPLLCIDHLHAFN